MNAETRDLRSFLALQPHETFVAEGRVDARRYLPREFPEELPLLLSLQRYPGWRQLVGDNWMHWHDYYELFIALSGEGEVVIGNDRFPFTSGDIIIVEPLKIHGVVRMEESHTALVILFHSAAIAARPGPLDRGFLQAWEGRPATALPRLRADHPVAGRVHGAILNLSRAWFSDAGDADRAISLKFHLLEMLFELRRGFSTGGSTVAESAITQSQREERLRKALEFVSAQAHRSLTQPEVARSVGMSTSRFREFFKRTTGWRFGDYLRDLRLDRSARLLRETDFSVAAVAQANGFADQSHLQRLFKAKYGISPLSYRRRHLERMASGEGFKK
jgi:AraC-like DNA-binding protein/mannose-6-phosphate isomerase-like protein (cupin superfamily)